MSDPVLQFVTGTVPICSACLDGEGGECHTPGCILWINRAPDLAIRSMLVAHGCEVSAEHPKSLTLIGPEDAAVLEAADLIDASGWRGLADGHRNSRVETVRNLHALYEALARRAANAGTPEEGQGG